MELRYLESFEAVVRCGGFTKAAEDLHLAQPAISSHIKKLEQELGVTLLHRSRTVTLSAAMRVRFTVGCSMSDMKCPMFSYV